MEDNNLNLKTKLASLREAEKMGGFRTIQDLRYLFPTFDGAVSQMVTLIPFICNEQVTIYNVEFQPYKCTTMTGEIADRILRDFPGYFNVMAINGLATKQPLEVREVKNGNREIVLDTNLGKPVLFDIKAYEESITPKPAVVTDKVSKK
jgi:hypothetical protein